MGACPAVGCPEGGCPADAAPAGGGGAFAPPEARGGVPTRFGSGAPPLPASAAYAGGGADLREIWRDLARSGEIWGDLARFGEIWRDCGRTRRRCRMARDMGRFGEIWRDLGRYGEIVCGLVQSLRTARGMAREATAAEYGGGQLEYSWSTVGVQLSPCPPER